MSIEKGYVSNFQTLIRAVKNGDIALLECTDAATGDKVVAVCAVQVDGLEVEMLPIAKLFNGNPYDELVPPAVESLNIQTGYVQ